MPNYQLTINNKNYQVSAPDESSLPEIADTIAKQDGNSSVLSQGLGYITQHPFKTLTQPISKTLTGNTLQNYALQASQIPIPQATQRPFDSNIQMVSTPGYRANQIGLSTEAGTLGSLGDLITTPINHLIPPALKVAGKVLPKTYPDTMVTQAGQSAINKIQSAINPLRATYQRLIQPFSNQLVDSDIFKKALDNLPDDVRAHAINKYGSKIVDENGNPSTTMGNLQKMELNLKDLINEPKFGQKLNSNDYDIAAMAQQIKNIRMSQYPQDTQDAIKALDKQFGPVVNMSDYLLPLLSNKAGRINTKQLYTIFNNPADAGTRDYLRNLNNLGVDLSPEIKTIQGWVKRKALMKSLKYMGGKAVEGATIGSAYKLLGRP